MRKDDQQEKNIRHFRTAERFVRIDGAWWFLTREGDEGPFATREAARTALRQYIAGQELAQKHQEEMEKVRAKTDRGDPKVWDRQWDVS